MNTEGGYYIGDVDRLQAAIWAKWPSAMISRWLDYGYRMDVELGGRGCTACQPSRDSIGQPQIFRTIDEIDRLLSNHTAKEERSMTTLAPLPPYQWSAFVRDNPGAEKPTPGKRGDYASLVNVNHFVNQIPFGGEPFPAPSEPWRINPPKAWCGDYAVTKRNALLKCGWPSSALRLAECITAGGEEHCVLLVSLEDDYDWYVLDNRTAAIRPAQHSGLKFVRTQSADDPNVWPAGGPLRED